MRSLRVLAIAASGIAAFASCSPKPPIAPRAQSVLPPAVASTPSPPPRERPVAEDLPSPQKPPPADELPPPESVGATTKGSPLAICSGVGATCVDYDSWVAALRVCTPATVAAARAPLDPDLAGLVKRKAIVAIAGRLRPTDAMCTLMDCGPSGCCNSCSFAWAVAARADCPNWNVAIRRAGQDRSLRGGGMDCQVSGFGRQAAEVIVSGRLAGDGDLIEEAKLCRQQTRRKSPQLDDADYARLMAPPPREEAENPGPCPSMSKGPTPTR